ncbi:MAG TPA: TetR/AcrR family transcriptional regulator [Solirubrobacteraceae bacterium]|nr:TetR/AcrR family transcriptional regulator [Solirubrobacteraceae bacterium]
MEAASAVFAREGFAAASVARIAEEAGATKPTLYARFGSKTELYEATLRYHAEAVQHELFAAYDRAINLGLGDAIREGVDAWFEFAEARPDGMRLLFGEDAGADSPLAGETTEAIIQRIASVTEHFATRTKRHAGPAATVIAALIVGACVHAIRRCLNDPSLDPGAVAALTTSFLTAACAGVDPELYAAINGTSR